MAWEQQEKREHAAQERCGCDQQDRQRGAAEHRALRIAQAHRPPGEEGTEPARNLGGSEQDADGRAYESHLLQIHNVD